ncbi:hypothetical protein HanLR1_Chr00c1633g0812171 [Helianthus annuus]|nr:hypothetical protein HanLR1_Chr00c1633g0812171 [Helianthus annuus]
MGLVFNIWLLSHVSFSTLNIINKKWDQMRSRERGETVKEMEAGSSGGSRATSRQRHRHGGEDNMGHNPDSGEPRVLPSSSWANVTAESMVRTVNTAVTTAPALKRENCSRTKHDSAFSDWKMIERESLKERWREPLIERVERPVTLPATVRSSSNYVSNGLHV